MPNYVDFENGQKRREMMEQLQKETKGRDIPGYEEFAKNMKELDELMDSLSVLDAFGLPKSMNAEAKKKLTDAIMKTAMSGEAYLQNAADAAENDPEISMSKGVPGMVVKLQGMMAKDLDAIEAYDPAKGEKSMPELLEDARSLTVDFTKGSLKKFGGSMTQRLGINVVNSKNEVQSGVFTAANKLDFLGRYNKAIENASAEATSDKEKEALSSLLPKYKAYMLKKDPSLSSRDDAYFADCLVREACGETDPCAAGQEVSEYDFQKVCKKIGVDDSLIHDSYDELCANFNSLNDGVDHANIYHAGLKDGDRVDSNNSGMSIVASVLGKPKLLVRAVPMKMRDNYGKVYDGTFMEYSKGLALNENDMNDYQALSNKPFEGSGAPFLRQIADIQVIDYICGNVDRHFGNLMYITNNKGKIIGVQAIDNDMSFGYFKDAKGRRKEMPGLDNMNCISRSTADKILDLKPEMLKFSLRGRGLSNEQIDFAAERLKELQNAIKAGEKHYEGRKPVYKDPNPFDKGFLRVVPDMHFNELSIDKMYIKGKDGKADQYNLYSEVETWTMKRLKGARKLNYKYDPNYTKGDMYTGTGKSSEQKYNSEGIQKPLSGAFKLDKTTDFNVDDLTVNNNGSTQFAEMVAAAKLCHRLEREYKKLSEEKKTLTAIDHNRYMIRMKKAIEDLNAKTDAYIDRKMGQRKPKDYESLKGKNEYERKRIDYAKKTRKWGRRAMEKFNETGFKELDLDNMSEIDKADYRSIKEKDGLDDRRAAMDALKKLHRELGLASPEKMMDNPELREELNQKGLEEQAQNREYKKNNGPQPNL